VATVVADLLTAEVRTTTLDELFDAWRAAVGRPADVVDLTFSEPTITPAGRNIEIRLSGPRLDELQLAMRELRQWFASFPGVLNLVDDLRPGKQEVRIRLREGVLGLGLDARTAAAQLRAAFYGLTADEIQVGPESYEIDVRLRREDQNGLADLDYFQFTLPGGRQIPLATAAVVESSRGWARIARINGLPTVTLRGDVNSRLANTQQLMGQLRGTFLPQLRERYPEVTLSLEGEIREGQTAQASMRRAMLIGMLGVFVLLSFQFRSYIEPLIVMAAIPLALIGVIWGHLIMRIDLCLPSVLGFISLAGIVVNDSILLVLFLKMRRREGADVLEAAAQASRLRFRAIVITSLTTIAGLLPLLAERSLQAQVLIPLAVSIGFGLMASTVLVLLVIPCLYAILGDLGLTREPDE
jgi:multidrug efflux pump subunit AcrB